MSTVEEQIPGGAIEGTTLLPILALRESVVFPAGMTPLAVGQERSIRLVDEAVERDRPIALVTARSSEEEAERAEDLYEVGTSAVIHKMIRVPDGTLRILVQGIERIRLDSLEQTEPYLAGLFTPLPDVVTREKEAEALARSVEALFGRIIELAPYLPEELLLAAANAETPSALANLIASTIRLKTEEKQQLLETLDVEERLRKLTAILSRELEVFELGTKLQSQVQEEMDKTQREYFLRQQLKAIQEELGETDEQQAEIAELRTQVDEAKLPEEADKQARRELDRLTKLPPAAAEYGVIRTYLEWILSLPWNATTEDDLDLKAARRILDEDHYDLEKVKERIVEHLAVQKLTNTLTGPILAFVGPPGVGKTSLGQSIARALGREFVRVSVGGVRDEAEIRGHRRTYIGAMPGTILRALRDAGSKNPVFMIDEIDKMGSDWRGDPSSAMLEVLDPAQNSSFRDHYLDLPVRPLAGPLRHDREPARDDPGAAPRPHGDHPHPRLHRGREGRDRAALPRPEAARRARARGQAGHRHREGAAAPRPRVHAGGGRAQPRPRDCSTLPQGRARDRRGQAEERPDRRGARAHLARQAPLLGRGAQADVRPRRGDRPRRDAGRRRRALRRGHGDARAGQAHRHRPDRRRHARVRPGRPLVGAGSRGRGRARVRLVRRAGRAHPRSCRSGAEGRALGGHRHGDRPRLARDRRAGLGGRGHDRRDHAHRPGSPDRRRQGEDAGGAAGRESARSSSRRRTRPTWTTSRTTCGTRCGLCSPTRSTTCSAPRFRVPRSRSFPARLVGR